MSVIGLQSAIWSNRFKTLLLVIFFPAILFVFIFLFVYFGGFSESFKIDSKYTSYDRMVEYKTLTSSKSYWEYQKNTNEASYVTQTISGVPILEYRLNKINSSLSKFPEGYELSSEYINAMDQKYISDIIKTFFYTSNIFIVLGPVIFVWMLISFFFHKQLIFSFTGAKPVTRKENPKIYNIVENLCMSRGLPVPKIGILEDNSLNAFAVGWKIKKSWIVFSRGLINKLSRQEIEAVAAHELTHIMNKDGLLMVVIICYIGVIASIGEILLRSGARSNRYSNSSSSSSQSANKVKIFVFLLGLMLLFLGYLVLPLAQLAVSRKREYLADAGSVQLTSDKISMINALKKISRDSTIESIKKKSVSALCIEDPFTKELTSSGIGEFFSTHPTIENRIAMLEKY